MVIKRIRKYIKSVIALGLITAIIVTSPIGDNTAKVVNAKDNLYIKELVLGYGKTEEEARKWLEKEDYKVVDGDINSGTSKYNKDANVVLIGYKTTTDETEAIRDIELMDMTGGFKITDMDTILAYQKNKIADSLEQLKTIAGEYKTNYKKAVKAKAKGKTDGMMALKTHDILNHFIEDNSGKKMGD
ncbi:MAG: hypothetical protein K6D02_02045, partial [Lachnospiraceae bacterium]|nr:hypothetical protein [Lachnospiraceae bacterium]